MFNNQRKNRRIKLAVIIVIIISASFYGGIIFSKKTEIDDWLINNETVFLGKVLNKYEIKKSENAARDVDFSLFWEVWDAIKDKYVDADKLKEKEMFYGALRGLVDSTGDPYSVFMNPVISKDFADDLKGTFEGIGAEIGIKGNVLTVIAPLTDMPAKKAGLRSGDQVLAIGGESTGGISLDEAVNKIRGPKGTDVTLTIWRDSFDEPQDFVITREKIMVKSVKWEINNDDIMIIEISHFNSDTEELFDQAVRETIKENPKGVILDLRNDPGGYLNTAIEVASEWIEEGPIVIEKFSEENKNEYLARGRARLKDYPTVVLVNQGSASASEIVAGALKDYKLATIVGMTTFGKGSVQEMVNFSDGSSVKITVAKWLTPEGVNISEEGIKPDEEVNLTIEDYNANKDPQMEKAIEILHEE
ncbi:MAG: S41 family peptidase [Patescibacteria group bacterium]|jgi:carboxyl-terminal processing protease